MFGPVFKSRYRGFTASCKFDQLRHFVAFMRAKGNMETCMRRIFIILLARRGFGGLFVKFRDFLTARPSTRGRKKKKNYGSTSLE